MAASLDLEVFKALDANPGGTLQKFNHYTERIELLFELVFRKADGTGYSPTDREKKAMLLFKGGDDMRNIFRHVGKVLDTDTYAQAVKKIKDGLSKRTNKVVQRNMLLANFPQDSKCYKKWSQEICNAAELIDYEGYDFRQAAIDAILLQTSNPKLRERGLQENVSLEKLLEIGISKEQSVRGAEMLEQASGQGSSSGSIKMEEEVRRLKQENKKLRSKSSKKPCFRCGKDGCQQGKKCPANGKTCSKCNKPNHFAKVCKTKKSDDKSSKSFGQVSSAEDSDSEESSGRVVVGKLDSNTIGAMVTASGPLNSQAEQQMKLATDTGISKTLLNPLDWNKIKQDCKFVKTSKRFRPYGKHITSQ